MEATKNLQESYEGSWNVQLSFECNESFFRFNALLIALVNEDRKGILTNASLSVCPQSVFLMARTHGSFRCVRTFVLTASVAHGATGYQEEKAINVISICVPQPTHECIARRHSAGTLPGMHTSSHGRNWHNGVRIPVAVGTTRQLLVRHDSHPSTYSSCYIPLHDLPSCARE